MEAQSARQTHPLMIIAAIAITLFSLVGIGAVLGWIPTSVGTPNTAPLFVVLRVDDQGRLVGKHLDTLEDILGAGGLKVREQLLVDGQVGCQDEEVPALADHEQVADEGAHQPRLAHPSSEGETYAGEVAFELLELVGRQWLAIIIRSYYILFSAAGVSDRSTDA